MGDDSRFRYRRDEGAAEGATRARPAPSAASEGDPLAELARLIGDADPFDDFHNLPADQPPQAADPRRSATAQRYAPPSAPPRQVSAVRPAPVADPYDDDADEDWSDAPPRYEPPARAEAVRSAAAQPQPRVGASRYEPPVSRAAQASSPQAPAPQAPAYGSAAAYAQAPARAGTEAEVRQGYGSLSRDIPARQPAPDDEDDYDERYDDLPPVRSGGATAPRQGTNAGASAYGKDRVDHAPSGARHDGRGGYAQDGYAKDGYAKDGYAKDGYAQGNHARDGYARDDDEAAYAYSSARRDDDAYDDYDDAYDPEYGEDGYMPPHGDEMYDAEPRRRKGRLALLLGASVVGVLVAGVAGVFAYNMVSGKSGFSSSGAPPVIKADSSPAKTATPPQPAADASGQKMIYDRMGAGGSGNERVVSREEQPVDVTSAAGNAQAAAAAAPPPPAAQPAQLLTEPKKVKTLTVRADGSLTQGIPTSSVSAYAASQNPIPAGLPEPNPVTTVPAGTAPAQTASTTPAPTANGGYVVQVASQRSEADAMGSWRALQSKYPNLLGNYRASVKKADLGDKGIYYRAQVGPFATRDQANDLCQSLRAQGGDCMVNKN